MFAAATVNSTGTLIANKGFTAIAHVPGSGIYTLTAATFPTNPNDVAVVITQAGLADGASTWLALPGQIIVRTFNTAGAAADLNFTAFVH